MEDPRPVVVKTFVVNVAPADTLAFFLDLKNWESGGILEHVERIDSEWWRAETPRGPARIRLRPNLSAGTFDHDFVGGGGEWTVFCRVTPNGGGSAVSWLFIQPEGMTRQEFERQLGDGFDHEMEGFRRALEARP